MRKLGKKGRFANQLFQYAYLRQEAKDEYQCPSWIGQTLFGLNDPAPDKNAVEIGYRFPKHSSYYDKELFKSLFVPIDGIKNEIDKYIKQFKQGRILVGLHLRRGDYGTFRRKNARWCFVAPSQWYLDWLADREFSEPVIFIASEEAEKLSDDFAGKYETFYWTDKNFYWDFYTLTQSDYLLISNSTFGFAASMLSQAECFRPRLSLKKLIPYDPWNAPLVFKDERY